MNEPRIKEIDIDGQSYTISYKETSIGDEIVNIDTGHTYIATISDADELNWIMIYKH